MRIFLKFWIVHLHIWSFTIQNLKISRFGGFLKIFYEKEKCGVNPLDKMTEQIDPINMLKMAFIIADFVFWKDHIYQIE